MPRLVRNDPRRWIADARGTVATIFAIAAPVVLGAGGLALDASLWARAQNNVQGAADQAALAVAMAIKSGVSSQTQLQAEAVAVAAQNGFTVGGAGGAGTITVNLYNPPQSGAYAGNSSTYQVVVTQTQQTLFSDLIYSSTPIVTGRATVAGAQTAAVKSTVCVLALDPTDKNTINLSGSGAISAPNCDVDANSASLTAVQLSGSARITAANFITPGNYTTSGGASVVANIETGHAAVADPFASLSVPTYSGCDQTNYRLSSSTGTISPGVYCGGISVSASTLNMNPGVYIVVGSFNVSGTSTINAGGGVSIVLTGSSGSYGSMVLSGGTTLNLSAPTSGSMAGIAMYFDRNAPYSTNDQVTGASGMNISGALYFPSRMLTYSGGSTVQSGCLSIVAYRFVISGPSAFDQTSCAGIPVAGGGSTIASTVGVPLE